jgi:hypothetical protein
MHSKLTANFANAVVSWITPCDHAAPAQPQRMRKRSARA